MGKTRFILISSLLFFVVSCARLPIYKSEWNSKQKQTSQTKISQFDKKAGLRYNVLNDHKRLYVSLKTSNPVTQLKILRRGVKIYVNTKGKKSKKAFLFFPDSQAKISESLRSLHNRKIKNRRKRLKELIATTFKEAKWYDNNKSTIIDAAKNERNFELRLNADSTGTLEYKVGIPLSDIHTKSHHKMSNLVIGIHINSFSNPQSGKQNHDKREYGGETGETGEGGMEGGRYRRNKRMGPVPQIAQPVNIWFKVKLASK